MTVFGHAVLFDCGDNREDTASPKTPMQWHKTVILDSLNTLDPCDDVGELLFVQILFQTFGHQ